MNLDEIYFLYLKIQLFIESLVRLVYLVGWSVAGPHHDTGSVTFASNFDPGTRQTRGLSREREFWGGGSARSVVSKVERGKKNI